MGTRWANKTTIHLIQSMQNICAKTQKSNIITTEQSFSTLQIKTT